MAKTTYNAPVKKMSAAVVEFKKKKSVENNKKMKKVKVEEIKEIVVKKKKKKKGKQLKELIKAQKGVGKEAKGIPVASFRRLVDDVMQEQATKYADGSDFRIGKKAVAMLKNSAEKCVTDLFKFANVTTVLNKRIKLMKNDFFPEVTRMFAPHIFEEEQCAEKANRGLKNITARLPQKFKKETDFD